MRAGALPQTTPARERLERTPLEPVESVEPVEPRSGDDRAAKVARLEVVRPGIRTAATLAHERTLPVDPALHDLVPSASLQRGSTIAVHGAGAVSFALAFSAEAIRAGSFLAVIAPNSFALGACLDFGIPLRRVVQFMLPDDANGRAGWPQLVAAVIEGFDVVVLADHRRVGASTGRQLVARSRERGSVLVRAGVPSWADAPDLRFDLHQPTWHGLGEGHGHLRSRVLGVQVAGRRWPGAPRTRHLRLSGDGVEKVTGPQPIARRPIAPRGAEPAVARHAGADIDELLAISDGRADIDEAHPSVDVERAEPQRRSFGTVA